MKFTDKTFKTTFVLVLAAVLPTLLFLKRDVFYGGLFDEHPSDFANLFWSFKGHEGATGEALFIAITLTILPAIIGLTCALGLMSLKRFGTPALRVGAWVVLNGLVFLLLVMICGVIYEN